MMKQDVNSEYEVILKDFAERLTANDSNVIEKRVKKLLQNWATGKGESTFVFGKNTPETLAIASYILGMADGAMLLAESDLDGKDITKLKQ